MGISICQFAIRCYFPPGTPSSRALIRGTCSRERRPWQSMHDRFLCNHCKNRESAVSLFAILVGRPRVTPCSHSSAFIRAICGSRRMMAEPVNRSWTRLSRMGLARFVTCAPGRSSGRKHGDLAQCSANRRQRSRPAFASPVRKRQDWVSACPFAGRSRRPGNLSCKLGGHRCGFFGLCCAGKVHLPSGPASYVPWLRANPAVSRFPEFAKCRETWVLILPERRLCPTLQSALMPPAPILTAPTCPR
jgi:hypothetical protein